MFFDFTPLWRLWILWRLFSFKIIQILKTVLFIEKISGEAKISYISYINYSEAWIFILRLIIRQNSCRIVTQAYMNPTWKKKCRIASPSKSQAKEERTQTTQTRLRRSNASLSLLSVATCCRSRFGVAW